MKFKMIILTLLLLLSFSMSRSEAQNNEDNDWNIIAHFQIGAFGNNGKFWYGYDVAEQYSSGWTEEYAEYQNNISFHINGGLEVSKGYLGLQWNFGMAPNNMKFTSKSFAGSTILRTFENSGNVDYFEVALVAFPSGSGVDKRSPFLTVGTGFCKALGMGGKLFSFGGGLRIFFNKKYGMLFSVKGFYIDFGRVHCDRPDPMAKHEYKPLQGGFGLIYCF
jgi:hypothetical protein